MNKTFWLGKLTYFMGIINPNLYFPSDLQMVFILIGRILIMIMDLSLNVI